MALKVSFTPRAMEWLASRGDAHVVIDLVYRKGRCTSAFCTMVPSLEVYTEKRQGRYQLEPVKSAEGRVVHVARPILEAAEAKEVDITIDKGFLGGLRLRGVDPYRLGL